MKTFRQFLEESYFRYNNTVYTCYFGHYKKRIGDYVEEITRDEYNKASKRYKKNQRLKLMRKHGIKRRKRIFKEEEQFFHAVDSNPNLYKERDGKRCWVFTQNYFHIFIYDKEGGNHRILFQFKIVGHEDLTDYYRRRCEDED